MCLIIDDSVKSLKKRVVWKVFDKECGGYIASLFRGKVYPKDKVIKRSKGSMRVLDYKGGWLGTHGLHFFTTRKHATHIAKYYPRSYIAKFAVDPADFMFANADKSEAMYEKAVRVGDYIPVKRSI